ncbi:MAG: LysR family transcriptional regulator [Zhongshania sp.]|uniref:LysR family transcriptional regulator n=1 Tax=Zhongshania sp. TaxID=1971902 RepID=UPI00260ECEB7|nr:LysR family transcriptional regulator [Zhongshania sp.]MDF1693420.1 LysR family transcriptional regulator [Zhongshania sp.]
MDTLSDIAIFIRVLDTGNISAAARSLGLSPAVASKRLISLEKYLGVRLLHRTTRRVSATPEGVELATQGRPLIEDLEALTSGLSQSGKEVSGTLRITAAVSFGHHYISPLLPRFLAQHPRLHVQLNLTDEKRDLINDGFDLAIRITSTLQDSGLVARRLARNRRIMCASPAYLARLGAPQTLAELSQHQCLLLAGFNGVEDRWQLTDKHGEKHSVKVKGRLESNLGDALRDAALSGLGISLHSSWHINKDLNDGKLQVVLPDYHMDTAIFAVMPQRRLVPPRVKAFIQFLEEQVAEENWA